MRPWRHCRGARYVAIVLAWLSPDRAGRQSQTGGKKNTSDSDGTGKTSRRGEGDEEKKQTGEKQERSEMKSKLVRR